MDILDCVETWLRSLRAFFESANVEVRFARSTAERLNASCAVNLRRTTVEADLVVWQSGEGELTVMKADTSVDQKHFDDLRKPQDLAAVLSLMIGSFEICENGGDTGTTPKLA